MKRTMIILLAALLFAMSLMGCADQKGPTKEKNTGRLADEHPYMIRMPSATWYLCKEDMEVLGEGAYCEGLYAILDDAEADMAEAREALKGYIPDEIEPIDIYTDFCDKTEQKTKFNSGAYYDDTRNFIKLFEGWNVARTSLLHEYVHYLTIHYVKPAARDGFWAEGAAEYISLFVCKNRMTRSVNMGFDLSELAPEMVEQTWNKEENCLEPRLVYLGSATMVAKGYAVGQRYFAVKNEFIVRTEQMQKDPDADDLTFYEAAGMFEYLIETFGKDTVFQNLDLDPAKMDTVYGKTFSELYQDWVKWNKEQCRQLGITTP